MIKCEQALIDAFINGSFGLPIAQENAYYKPTEGVAYVGLRTFWNEQTPVSLTDSDEITGLLQFTLNYPKGAGAIPAKQKRQEIFDAFPIGTRLTYGGQTVVVMSLGPFNAAPDDGWFRVVGRIYVKAELTR